MTNLDDLRWVRIIDPMYIPRYLVEQIKQRDFSVDDFYRYNRTNCYCREGEDININAFNHIYVLADNENCIKGFLWFFISPLTKFIGIQSYSVDKEYWGAGRAVAKVSEFLEAFMEHAGIEKVQWISSRPKYFEKYGFSRSKFSLIEYKKKEKKDGTVV